MELMDVPENSTASSSHRPKVAHDEPSNLSSIDAWLQERLPDWPRVWAACVRRTHAWRVPPRWTPRDWWEEIDAESVASACLAVRIFDPDRGPTLASFMYFQIVASALARYRQEWNYALRNGLYSTSEGHPSDMDDVENRFAVDQELKTVRRLMTDLPESDRRLIESLFWDNRTENEVAGGLGISQQAVCKRKHRILSNLRNTLAKKIQK
jgi:DNA-directed RNA polymerase specialized sigma24 family protein